MQRNLHCFFRSEGRLIAGTIRFFDLFSGIGGFREGLHRAGGFTCVGHCEADAYADHNYRVLFDTEGEWFCNDARNIETERMPDFDLLCAGFPCQAFSIAGRREGFADARGTLFFEVARLVADKRPAYFLLENVPGLLSHDKGRTFHTILSTLSELGYHVEWKVLNSKDFGVPQSRKRVYIVGYLDGRCAGKILPFSAKEEIVDLALSTEDDILILDPESEFASLVEALNGEVIRISATSDTHLNALDMDSAYGNDRNPLIEKSEFILSLFEQLVGAGNLSAKEKSILDRCTADVYRDYMRGGYKGQVPTLKDLYRQLMLQPEEEARGLALSSELFINGSLNTFAQETNVNTKSRIIDYDIRELGEQLMPLGMLVTLDSIFNRVIQNWKKGKTTWIFADEFYLLFRYEYSADFFYRLYKRIRKYSGFVTGLTQNVEELLKSDTARLMLANSEFLILLNQATTDRDELAALLNISDNQLSYITNVGAGHGLIRCSGNLVPFENSFPRNTKLYRLMTTKPGEG